MSNDVDIGQRYEVRSTGWPDEDREVAIAWCPNIRGATQIMNGALKAPGCTSATVIDRLDGSILVRRFVGVL